MTEEEKKLIKEFISYYEDKNVYLNENDIFTGDDKKVTMKVLNFIMFYQVLILDYFSFNEFLKPLIKKLATKLFNYGMITADDCLYYINISLR